MAMLKYVKRVKEDNNGDAVLPSSSGPLATTVPSSRIDAIDDAVKPVVETLMEKGKAAARGPYENFSADEKARVAKRTAEYGVLSTVRHFSKIWSERPLKEGTVRGWRNKYNREVYFETVRERDCCKRANRPEVVHYCSVKNLTSKSKLT